jgi:hypothetical protein
LSIGEKENRKITQMNKKTNVSISRFGDNATISQTFRNSAQIIFFQFES